MRRNKVRRTKNPQVIGYGEDALTYWALTDTKRLKCILKKLKDKSDPSKCLIIYRPSFGREGRSKSSFGEFDSILATPLSIYLIESKWDGSYPIKQGKIKLKNKEITTLIDRHNIFPLYFELKFRKGGEDKLKNELKKFKKDIAPAGSKLSNNLEFIIKKLREFNYHSSEIKNVLLFFTNEKSVILKNIEPNNPHFKNLKFKKITFHYEINKVNYFDMIPI